MIKATFGNNSDNLSIKIKNILLQGCSFKNGVLCEGEDQSEFTVIPPINITLVKAGDSEPDLQ